MEGLSENVDLTPLVGRQVESLLFGFGHIIMRFDDRVSIGVECTILMETSSGHVHRIEDFRADAVELCGVMGLSIVDAKRTPSGGLSLRLSSGTRMEIENSNSHYESFQIYIGDQVFVA